MASVFASAVSAVGVVGDAEDASNSSDFSDFEDGADLTGFVLGVGRGLEMSLEAGVCAAAGALAAPAAFGLVAAMRGILRRS